MKWAATLPAGDGAGLRGLYLRDNALTELPPGGAVGRGILELGDDILREPIMVVDSTGRVVRVIRN
ncbi:MAG: hypothetical protein F4Z50_14090 [Gemmatimonadetes bacterium]|nr:hypothetical protein [Gemmatimonadota bacterium]MYD13539.1 hypothetical protein [Gemmatimonadota bacterium]